MTRTTPVRRRRGQVLAALALLALPAAAEEEASRLLQGELPRAIARELRRPSDPPRPLAARAEEHAPAARASVDALVELVARERAPAYAALPEAPLDPHQRELALALVARVPVERVLVALERLPEDVAPARRALCAIDVLGAVAGASELELLFEQAGEVAARLAPDRRDRALRGAVSAILRRDPSAYEWLLARWGRLAGELLEPVLLGVADAASPLGHELLADVVRMRSRAAPVAIAQMARLGPAPERARNDALCELLRPLLDPGEPETCRAASTTLALFEDCGALPRWIELLGAEPRGLGENALWALRRVSGLRFPASPALWRSWLAEEEAWFERRLGSCLAALEGGGAAGAAGALRELSGRRIHRGEVATLLARGLGHPSPTVRVLACRTIAAFGRPEAAPELRIARGDPDPAVGRAAAAALEVLTGETWGDEAEAEAEAGHARSAGG